MPTYAPLLRVDVVHQYFADPASLQLRFLPDARTAAWLERTGSVLRELANAMIVFYDTEGRGGRPLAAGADVELAFDVVADDPLFAEYTQAPPPPNLRPPRFSGTGAAADESGVWRLSEPQGPGLSPKASAASFRLELPVSADLREAGRRYRLDLASRAIGWKYILLGDWGDHSPRVDDPEGAFAFGSAAPETLADGRAALSFVSEKAIPLAERPAQRFQLRGAGQGGAPGPVLIASLPAAAPGRLALDRARDPPTIVSEIYVDR